MNHARLRQLQRQRELLLEHLGWLELEIERENGTESSSAPSPSRLGAAATEPEGSVERTLLPTPENDVEAASSAQAASDIYDRLGPDTRSAAADAKRGCLIAGFTAFAALAAAIAAVILWY